MAEKDQPLTCVQLCILELESMTWKQGGSKISEFRQRHPRVTETAYYVALLRLLRDPRAYEYRDRKYASMLTRLAVGQRAELARRAGLRNVSTE